ncbi:hypothetical protein [Hymenobacter chitinivorans]|uniref:Uncharacterized protein n=1 Tax=Hymenobacter chitinivorans DSM 11115 TaxID=1121954 RepID=A0A2M9BKY0_9BACT|nr:hypothetical protein [Hymenobacter chitinivorans]PJJ58592.1 hypothetical protein CLV45_0002 [Hymenobacter chitinivorans DSM 11115]
MPPRLLLLLSFFLVTTLLPQAGQAQSARKRARLAAAGPVLTRKDTAYAVHELFFQRRTGGAFFTGYGVAMTGIVAVGSLANPPKGSGEVLPSIGVVAVMGALPIWLGVSKHRRYNLSREQVVLTDYAKTGFLDRKYRRRLRGICRPVPGNRTWPAVVTDTLAPGALPPVAATPPATPATDSAARVRPAAATGYTMADSLDAVAGLFASRRLGGQIPLLAVLPAARLMTGSSGKEYNMYTGQFEDKKASGGAIAAGLGLVVGSFTYMILHNSPYTQAKLAEIRTACEAGAPIPAKVRVLLKPRHFEAGREERNRQLRRAARKIH